MRIAFHDDYALTGTRSALAKIQMFKTLNQMFKNLHRYWRHAITLLKPFATFRREQHVYPTENTKHFSNGPVH